MRTEELFNRSSIGLLLVEDEPSYVEYITKVLADDRTLEFVVTHVNTLGDALDELKSEDHDAALIDMGLSDSEGLATVKRALDGAGDTAVLVLTNVEDQVTAREALALGAQEYLVKDRATPEVLTRAVRYAVDRQILINQLRTAREAEARERELRHIERLAADPPLRATAAMYGNQPLAERAPERMDALREEYGRVLDDALELRVFDTAPDMRADLRSMAGVLGYLGATPRDVVNVHTQTLRVRLADASYERGQAYMDEGRVLVLELMGYLASWYRTRAMGAPATEAPPTGASSPARKMGA